MHTLWHYTDAAGMLGIVTARQLWFGDSEFLNDRTERRYGQTLRKEIIEDIRRAGDPTGIVAAIDAALDWFGVYRLYLCSFSASNDESISQWQRYGADGAGYCIGFDAVELDNAFAPHQVYRVPMIYQPVQQRQLLQEVLERTVREYESGHSSRFDTHRLHWLDVAMASDGVGRLEMQMKSPYFSDEAEWRYFREIDDDHPISGIPVEFHARGHYIKPFVAFPPRSDSMRLLPIRQVIVGPRLDAEIAASGISRFLRSSGYGDVRVDRSKLCDTWR